MSVKISEMSAATTMDSSDILPVVDISAGTSGSKKITLENLIKTISANTPVGTTFDATDVIDVSDPTTGDTVKVSVSDFINALSLNMTAGTSSDVSMTKVVAVSDASTGATKKITVQAFMNGVMSSADTATTLASTGKVFVVDDTGKFVSIALTNFNNSSNYATAAYSGWILLPLTFTCVYKQVDSGGSIVTVSDWGALTSYSLGDFVKNPAGTSMYKCIKAGVSGAATPAFNDGSWIDELQEAPGGPWWRTAFPTVVQTTTSMSSLLQVGDPFRLGTAMFNVKAVSGQYVALNGRVPLTPGSTSPLCFVADPAKVKTFDFNFANNYTTVGTSEDLFTLYKRGFVWRGSRSIITEFSVLDFTNDSTGINYINIRKNAETPMASWENTGKGITVDTTWTTADPTAWSFPAEVIEYGDTIEFVKDTDGSTANDAKDLNVSITVVTI